MGSLRRVSEDSLESQFTAKDLIGKELYDRSGKRIGEVKDIVLASSVNPQLAAGLSRSDDMTSAGTSTARSGSATTRTASGSVGGVGASGSVTTSESGVGVSANLGGTSGAGSTSASEMARHGQSMMGSMAENAVIVSHGGILGAGDSLIRIPLSQLNFDSSNEHITVNVSESEISSLSEATESSRSAAE